MPEEFDIAQWLESFGLGQYASVFQEHEITAEVLAELSDDDLKQCGVNAIGHRKILLREIRKLSGDVAPPPAAPQEEPATSELSAASDEQHETEAAEEPAPPQPPRAPGPFIIPPPDAVRRTAGKTGPSRPPPPKSPGPLIVPVPDAVRRETASAQPSGAAFDATSTSPATGKSSSRPRIGFWAKILASKFLFISILVHLLFGAGATYFVVQRIQAKRKLTFQGGPPTTNPSTRALEHKVSMAQKQKAGGAPPQAKRIMTAGLSAVALPEMPSIPMASNVVSGMAAGMGGAGFGSGMGMGNGMGSGMGGGGIGGGGGGLGFLPRTMADRCSPTARAAALMASGGDPKCEEAVIKALRNLKERQKPDGSFGQSNHTAMTGLALLSFLGHCERPTSVEFGPTVRKAIDFLLKASATNGGKLCPAGGNHWVYEHAIGAYALGEAYILTREEAIVGPLSSAIAIIVSGQGADGGWVYGFTKAVPSDTSVSGWQIQALKAAHLAALNIEGVDECLKKSTANILRVQGPKGGFGYHNKEDKWGLTGVGILCLQIGGEPKGGAVREGLKFLLDDKAPEIDYKSKDANLYAWYYNTQACFQAGGSSWGKWRRGFLPQVLKNQKDDGSWAEAKAVPEGAFHYTGTGNTEDAIVYRTTLCTLMLEVFYRYLATSKAM